MTLFFRFLMLLTSFRLKFLAQNYMVNLIVVKKTYMKASVESNVK